MRITHDAKETAIEAIKTKGTMKAGAEAAGVSVRTLNEEMRRSAIFKRRVLEAREEGKRNIADNAIDKIKEYAFNPPLKTDRNVLTAAIALANAYEPGFRGSTTIQGKIDHDIRVITAVPRPSYQIIEPEKKLLDNPNKKKLKSRKRVKIVDREGRYIGTQIAEETIEGEMTKESE
uniref:Uncharacterized protein n=1 Tax=viral metagenome TaxID=1070528 RepID=A0A6M3KHA6_9ZZZZ